MYLVNSQIKGIVPILQHKFSLAVLDELGKGSTRNTGSKDYSLEWLETMYENQGYLYQPATHIEGALVRAATSFRIKGKAGKTWKDPIKAYCYVLPNEIPLSFNGVVLKAPDKSLLYNPTEALSVSVMRAKVNGSAVPRMRLMICTGWVLDFQIEVHDEQVRPEVLEEILKEAGRAVGVGDYRPRYGRFEIIKFEVKQ